MVYVFFRILKFRIKVFLYICTYVGMYVYIYNGFYIFKTCEYFLKCMFGPSEHWVAWHLYTTYSSKSTQAALPIVLVQQKSAPLSLAQWIEIVSIEAQISIKRCHMCGYYEPFALEQIVQCLKSLLHRYNSLNDGHYEHQESAK